MREAGTPRRSSVSIAEARDIILAAIVPLGPQRCPIREAVGRILAERIDSDRSIPPADNSAMDGYAVRAEDLETAPVELQVIGVAAAGHAAPQRLASGQAIRILTGAAIPTGADAVVMQEDTELSGTSLSVLEPVSRGQHIRRAGCDVAPGTPIAAPGEQLSPALVGMCAALGRSDLEVIRRPRVAILATGDELVEPEDLQDDGRIVTSNSYTLFAALTALGVEPVYLGIARDEPDIIEEHFRRGLECDAVISTGGVSVGDRDWIKQVLAKIGGEMHLWRVLMKPGAPLAFVTVAGRPVFGLPGNPVSTLVAFEQFVRPALLKMMGHTRIYRPTASAELTQPYKKPAGRAHLIRVKLETRAEDGRLLATPTGDQSSAILLSMVEAQGLAFVAESVEQVAAGEALSVQLLGRDDFVESPGF